jgi:hypothetical protein
MGLAFPTRGLTLVVHMLCCAVLCCAACVVLCCAVKEMLLSSSLNLLMLCVPLGIAAHMCSWGPTAVFTLVRVSPQACSGAAPVHGSHQEPGSVTR